jgi:hypothetical protein
VSTPTFPTDTPEELLDMAGDALRRVLDEAAIVAQALHSAMDMADVERDQALALSKLMAHVTDARESIENALALMKAQKAEG